MEEFYGDFQIIQLMVFYLIGFGREFLSTLNKGRRVYICKPAFLSRLTSKSYLDGLGFVDSIATWL